MVCRPSSALEWLTRETRAGCRCDRGCVDHIFVRNVLGTRHTPRIAMTFAFSDKKAEFDTINRAILWHHYSLKDASENPFFPTVIDREPNPSSRPWRSSHELKSTRGSVGIYQLETLRHQRDIPLSVKC